MKEAQQNRHIELAVVKVEGEQVTFRIAEQTHREGNFTPNGEEFKSSCGVILSSKSFPEYKSTPTTLFVHGWKPCKDDNQVTVPLLQFAKIMQAITEYNETNGKGYEKPWPQDGDGYYFLDSGGIVCECTYVRDYVDESRREFGNFFRTHEEAEAALKKIKRVLKGDD